MNIFKFQSTLVLLAALNFSSLEILAQNCNPNTDEEYFLKTKTLNLRSKPDKNSTIIKVLDEMNHSLIIVDSDSIINNFILVKAIEDTTNYETMERVITAEFYGWVSYELVKFNSDSYSFIRGGEPDEGYFREVIQEQEVNKYNRSCKYNPSLLSYAYCESGKILFNAENYIEAIELFNKAIEVSTINSSEEKFVSLYYRGKSKMNLNDNYGAIMDLSRLAGHNNTSLNNRFVIGWAYKSNNHAIRMRSVNVPVIDEEDVYLNLAVCKAQLKKYSEALTDVNTVLLNNKKSGNAYYVRAQINLNAKKKQEGCIDASKAGELGIEEAYELISTYCN